MRLKRIVALLVGLLVLSLSLNVYGFDLLRGYYRELHETRLNPLGLDAFSAIAEPDLAHLTAVFFGDSRAQDWPMPDNLPDYTFINRGIGAQTSAQIALRFAAHIEPLQPDILIVQMCINDLKTIPLFPERKAEIIAQCQAHLATIIAEARTLDARVIVTTIFPVGAPPLQRRLVWSDEIALAVNAVNEYIRARSDVLVLDTFALLADENGLLRVDYSQDELHLNVAGYGVLNAALVEMLTEMHDE